MYPAAEVRLALPANSAIYFSYLSPAFVAAKLSSEL